jgi:drug/metabolite transporter (DMT)-like permease
MLAQACFFFTSALVARQSDEGTRLILSRFSWWDAVLPAAMWFHLTTRMHGADVARRRRAAITLVYGCGGAIVVLGSFTNLVLNYGAFRMDARGPADTYVPAGPLYVVFTAYVLCSAALGIANLVALVRHEQASRGTATGPGLRMLAWGGLLFLAGAGLLTVNQLAFDVLPLSQSPGNLALVAGLALFGYTIARYNALLSGNDVRRDFAYSVCAVAVAWLTYLPVVVVLVGLDDARQALLSLLLMLLVTSSHTLYDTFRTLLDRFFFSQQEREELQAARAFVVALGTEPAGPDQTLLESDKALKDAVRKAITWLQNPTQLAGSPLLGFRVVQLRLDELELENNLLQRAVALRDLLIELIDGLRPAEREGGTSDAWRFYNCLHYPYVRGISLRTAPTALRAMQERRRRDASPKTDAERVTEWLTTVNENTYFRWQRVASDTIAETLRELELATAAQFANTPAAGPPSTNRSGTSEVVAARGPTPQRA